MWGPYHCLMSETIEVKKEIDVGLVLDELVDIAKSHEQLKGIIDAHIRKLPSRKLGGPFDFKEAAISAWQKYKLQPKRKEYEDLNQELVEKGYLLIASGEVSYHWL